MVMGWVGSYTPSYTRHHSAISATRSSRLPFLLPTYLCQACPVVAPLAGCYFGNKGAVLDVYSANLAATLLPGQGHSRLHNKLQVLLQSMVKLGSIFSEKDTVNFLIGKVPEININRYIHHQSECPNAYNPFTVVPDIHAYNYPAGR